MGDMTYDDYEEMFYKFAKPLKIYRHRIPLPYRTVDEIKHEDYVRYTIIISNTHFYISGDLVWQVVFLPTEGSR